jgi:hypothetical protein
VEFPRACLHSTLWDILLFSIAATAKKNARSTFFGHECDHKGTGDAFRLRYRELEIVRGHWSKKVDKCREFVYVVLTFIFV